ncbi:MAG: DVU_1557 family redox protein [Syntrophorhabdales bacterium]
MREKEQGEKRKWICGKCGIKLESCKVQVSYMGSVFFIDLPKCPGCGMVLVTDEIASGKMAEAEQLLEDK